MDGVVRHFDKERLPGMPVDKTGGTPRDLIGQVTCRCLQWLAVLVQIRYAIDSFVTIVVVSPAEESEELVEAMRVRRKLLSRSEMPFAEKTRRVSCRLQQCGERR